jgi:hypothetical protein
VPANYCSQCRAKWDKRQQNERDQNNARQRELYQSRKRREEFHRGVHHHNCATCGNEFKPKRAHAVYCCAACRQRAYVKRDGKPSNSKPLDREQIEAIIEATLLGDQDNAYTVDNLCDRVYPGLKRFEPKHHVAVIPAAKRVCERLGERWDWRYSWTPGRKLVFWNRASILSYGMAELKTDQSYLSLTVRFSHDFRNCTDNELKAKLSPGGDYYDRVIAGGNWWKDRQEDIARFKAATAA